jgi:hypothetical protein
MSEPDRYPAGVPCWIETLQPDPRAALATWAGHLDSPCPATWSASWRRSGATARIQPPADAPGFRSAVLADPQGAVFSVSQLTAGP